MLTSFFFCCIFGLKIFLPVKAIQLDVNSADSIKSAAKHIVQGLLGYYHGTEPGQTVGLLSDSQYSWKNSDDVGIEFDSPYWWTAGAVWAGLLDYWQYTGDVQYIDLVQQALLAQAGPESDYMPLNQTKTECNDDQAIWALASMTAAETQFPTVSNSTSWLKLAQNVFDLQASRWDTSVCNGGLRWQIFALSTGYHFKNSFSHATFFQLAARLAKFTGNQTYADWADKGWDWTSRVGLIDADFNVFYGARTGSNCSGISKLVQAHTAGAFLYGSAVMYNETKGGSKWKDRTQNLLSAMSVFFPEATSEILIEPECKRQDFCDGNYHFYKGLTAQWLGSTMQVASFTVSKISSYVQKSAEGAARQCIDGKNGSVCGLDWTLPRWDGTQSAGQQLSALNIILANLALKVPSPFNTNSTITRNSSATTSSSSNSASASSEIPSSTPSEKPSSGVLHAYSAANILFLSFGAVLLVYLC